MTGATYDLNLLQNLAAAMQNNAAASNFMREAVMLLSANMKTAADNASDLAQKVKAIPAAVTDVQPAAEKAGELREKVRTSTYDKAMAIKKTVPANAQSADDKAGQATKKTFAAGSVKSPFDSWINNIDKTIKAVDDLERKIGKTQKSAMAIGTGAEQIVGGVKTLGAPVMKAADYLAQPPEAAQGEQSKPQEFINKVRMAVQPAAQSFVSLVESTQPYVTALEKGIGTYKDMVDQLSTVRQILSGASGVLETFKGGFLQVAQGIGSVKGGVGALKGSFEPLKGGMDFFKLAGEKLESGFSSGVNKILPQLQKMSGWVSGFVRQFMTAAVRIAGGWMIAMGPVGIIIAVVTAIVAAAIWAWENNFLGFRDGCLAVWDAISGWAQKTWDAITDFIRQAFEKAVQFIEKVKNFLGFGGSQAQNVPEQTPANSAVPNAEKPSEKKLGVGPGLENDYPGERLVVHRPITQNLRVTNNNTFHIQSIDTRGVVQEVIQHIENAKYVNALNTSTPLSRIR